MKGYIEVHNSDTGSRRLIQTSGIVLVSERKEERPQIRCGNANPHHAFEITTKETYEDLLRLIEESL